LKNKTIYVVLLSVLFCGIEMQHEAVLYSLDSTITKKQLKEKELVTYDKEKYNKLQERVQEKNIQALFVSDTQKFFSIKPEPYLVYCL
jgi:hypothetical protein